METDVLASSLRSAIAALHKGLRKQMYSVDTWSLTEMETVGLLSRSDEPMLPSQLALLTHVKTQSMSQILKKMEDQKIIKRTPSPDDKRNIFISLTPHGRKLIQKTQYEKDIWLATAIREQLTEKEKESISKALPALNKLINTTK